MEELKYPTGRFSFQQEVSNSQIPELIRKIEDFPELLIKSSIDLTEEMLTTQYRPEGWTARQVIHHIADSHINAYIRFKLTLTEDMPTVKTYSEKKWAEMEDSKTTPAEVSLNIVESVHKRWVRILKSMELEQFNLKYIHPENGEVKLRNVLALYAWHGGHHLGHINIVRKNAGLEVYS